MKNKDLKPCALCRKGLLHAGLPLFWQLTIQRQGIDGRKLRELQATTHLLGNFGLAEVMTGNDSITQPVGEPIQLLVCETCATQSLDHHCVVSLAEIGTDTKEDHNVHG